MFCPNCGTQQEDGLKFCTQCGGKLGEDFPAPPAPQKAARKPGNISVGFAIGIVTISVFVVMIIIALSPSNTNAIDEAFFGTDSYGNLKAYYEVLIADEAHSDKSDEFFDKAEDRIKATLMKHPDLAYRKITLSQNGRNAAYKVIKDEGYLTAANHFYMIVFSNDLLDFSNHAVEVFVKFDKNGSARFKAYEMFEK
jgi:hypothetical protein